MQVWRDDGSQVTSVAECWQQCADSLGDSLVGVDFWPAGWLGFDPTWDTYCGCHDVCDDMEDWNLDWDSPPWAAHPVETAVRPEHSPKGYTCNVPPSPPAPPAHPPHPTAPYYNFTRYADWYCGTPAGHDPWVVHAVPTSAAEAGSTCGSPLGTFSVMGEWCDFSGYRPRLHGTYYHGSNDCSTAPEPLGDSYYGFSADGSCVQHSDGTSSVFHCVVTTCATGDERMCSSTGCWADLDNGEMQTCDGGFEARPSQYTSYYSRGAYTCFPPHCPICDFSKCASTDGCYMYGDTPTTCAEGYTPVPIGRSQYTCCFDTQPPLPPGQAPAPPPPLPPSLIHATTGPCVVAGDCVCSSNYLGGKCDASTASSGQSWGGNEACTVSFAMPVTLSVQLLDEYCAGELTVEGNKYVCNPEQLDGKVTNYMTWNLDSGKYSTGFKICAHAPSPPYPPGQAPAMPPPAHCIGDDSKCTDDDNDCYADGVWELQTCVDGFLPMIAPWCYQYSCYEYSCYPLHCSRGQMCDDSKKDWWGACTDDYMAVAKGDYDFTCCPEAVPPSPPEQPSLPPKQPPCEDVPAPFGGLNSPRFPARAECGEMISPDTLVVLNAMVDELSSGLGSTPACTNKDSNCEYWAFLGMCEVNTDYMLSNCMVSCATCPSSGPVLCDGMNEDNYCDCSGDCTYKPELCACKAAKACCEAPSPSPQSESVSCGGHYAASCLECPTTGCPSGNCGAAWCNGDCTWDNVAGECTSAGAWPPSGDATRCSQGADGDALWQNCAWIPSNSNSHNEVALGSVSSPDECIEMVKEADAGFDIANLHSSGSGTCWGQYLTSPHVCEPYSVWTACLFEQPPLSLDAICRSSMQETVDFWGWFPDGFAWQPPAGVGMEEMIATICPATCATIGVYATPACAPHTPYTANTASGNTCEEGEAITDAAECQAAAASLGIAHFPNAAYRSDWGFLGKIHEEEAPGGCVLLRWRDGETSNHFLFNMHPGGSGDHLDKGEGQPDYPVWRKVCKGDGPPARPTPPTPPAPPCMDADHWGSLANAIQVHDNGTYTPMENKNYTCTEVLDLAVEVGGNMNRAEACATWLSQYTLATLRDVWARDVAGPEAEYTPPAGYPESTLAVELCAATCGEVGVGRCAPPSPPSPPSPPPVSWSLVGNGLQLGSSNRPEDKATFTITQPAKALKLVHTAGAISCHDVPSPCCGCEPSNWGASDKSMFIWIADASTGEAVAPMRGSVGTGYRFGQGSSDYSNIREAASLIFHVNLPAGTYHVLYQELNNGPRHLEDNDGITIMDVYTLAQPQAGTYTTLDVNGYCSGTEGPGTELPLHLLMGDLTRDECWEQCSGMYGYNYAQFTLGVYGEIDRGACTCHESCDAIIQQHASLVLGPCGMAVPPPILLWVVAWLVQDSTYEPVPSPTHKLTAHTEAEVFLTEREAQSKFNELNGGPHALRMYVLKRNTSHMTREYSPESGHAFFFNWTWTMLDDWATAQNAGLPATWPYWSQQCATPPAPPATPPFVADLLKSTESFVETSESLSGGAIAGIALGCLAVILALLVVLYYFMKKKKNEGPTITAGAAAANTPTTATTTADIQMASNAKKENEDQV